MYALLDSNPGAPEKNRRRAIHCSLCCAQFMHTMHTCVRNDISWSESDRVNETKAKLYVYSIFRFTWWWIFSATFLNHHFVFVYLSSLDTDSTTTMMRVLHFFFFCASNFSSSYDDCNFRALSALFSLNRLLCYNICMFDLTCFKLNWTVYGGMDRSYESVAAAWINIFNNSTVHILYRNWA